MAALYKRYVPPKKEPVKEIQELVDETKNVHDLELPVPDETSTQKLQPDDDAALPHWLSKPTVVSSSSRGTFSELGLSPESVNLLSKLGFEEALPVQQAVLPVLLPPGTPGSRFRLGLESVVPDVAVSAATGSGKTIAYLLPIIEGLRRFTNIRKLRALIIVPTKELVQQVAAVAESLAKGSNIRIGTCTGSSRFRDEQQKLVRCGQRHDPTRYAELMAQARRRIQPIDDDSDDFAMYVEDLSTEDAMTEKLLKDTISGLVDHVPTYEASTDILIATPGRLLEHINSTLGFSLVHLEWLVIDEVDKLLDNQFEGFLETINAESLRTRTDEEQDTRERYLRSRGAWDERKERRVRKAILSATMTRDISKLTSLRLRRPQMIVVRSGDQVGERTSLETPSELDDLTGSIKETVSGFELPRTLVEYCVPAGDGSEKPLIALELLQSKILSGANITISEKKHALAIKRDNSSDLDSTSSSDSNDDSSISSMSSEDSTSSSDSSDSDESEAENMSTTDEIMSDAPFVHPDRIVAFQPVESPTILVFTSSNESTHRLSYLLKRLRPEWSSWITTLTKHNTSKGPHIQSKADEPVIVVSTDRAARGLDSIRGRPITHVVQYDVPRSLTSYVHRVGRTARAGRKGDAWTLFTRSEGRWFDHEILRSKSIKRASAVERVKLFIGDDRLRDQFKDVLGTMREEVFGG